MSAVNNIHIIGRLGKDPEMRYSTSGTAVAKVSVAVDNRRKKDDDQPDWFNVVAFGKTAEFLNEYGAKGRLTALQGEMHQSRWEDSDGNPRISWELTANAFQFLDKPFDRAQDKPFDRAQDKPPERDTHPDDEPDFG